MKENILQEVDFFINLKRKPNAILNVSGTLKYMKCLKREKRGIKKGIICDFYGYF